MTGYGYHDQDGPLAARPTAGPYDRSSTAADPYPHPGDVPAAVRQYGVDAYGRPYADPSGRPGGYPTPGHRDGTAPYPSQRPEHPQGTAVLLLGILGLMAPPAAFVAWYLGSRAQREIEESGLDYANSGNLVAGRLLGMVVSILCIVGFGLMLLYLVFGLLAFTTDGF